MKRILVLAAIALAGFVVRSPLAAAAPPGHIVRLGILDALVPTFDPTADSGEFVDGLRNLGYTPGRDIVFEYKSPHGNGAALPQLAEELVRSGVDILADAGGLDARSRQSDEDRPDRHDRQHRCRRNRPRSETCETGRKRDGTCRQRGRNCRQTGSALA